MHFLTGLTVISGIVSDNPVGTNSGINNVKLSIKNTSTTEYWSGTAWGQEAKYSMMQAEQQIGSGQVCLVHGQVV